MTDKARQTPQLRPQGLFVMGAPGSGIENLDPILSGLGLLSVSDIDRNGGGVLGALNDKLLAADGGSRAHLPKVSPRGALRVASSLRGEARAAFETTVNLHTDSSGGQLWFWSDPALSILTLFWREALGIEAISAFVHGAPRTTPSSPGDLTSGVLDQWDRYTRAALMSASELPSLVLSYESLANEPGTQVALLLRFLGCFGLTPTPSSIHATVSRIEASEKPLFALGDVLELPGRYDILSQVLHQLDGIHLGDEPAEALTAVTQSLEAFYDDDYYRASYDQSGVPYQRTEPIWTTRFASLAEGIVKDLAPKTVLDAGCASGMLVEALRLRDVDAHGIDISRAAINQVPPELRPYCSVGSITAHLQGPYDLIICSEVLEHLPPFGAQQAIANLCRHSDSILFSSTPDDFAEPTHLNVQTTDYWAQLFLEQGFVRDGDVDASFLAPHAAVFRRQSTDPTALVTQYERALENLSAHLREDLAAPVEQTQALAERDNAISLESAEQSVRTFEQIRRYEHAQKGLAILAQTRLEQIHSRDEEMATILRTRTFRYARSLRNLYGRLRALRQAAPSSRVPEAQADDGDVMYRQWVDAFDTITDTKRQVIADEMSLLRQRPLISLLMPVFDPPPEFLRAAIESVIGQIYTEWELCIADDCSTNPEIRSILQEYADRDPRVRVVHRSTNGHISAASNSTLQIASGTWVGCVDHDDLLAEHALAVSAIALDSHADVGIVYSDDDKLDSSGRRYGPYFKPDFDPLLLLGQNYLAHFSLFRRDLVEAAGGFRVGYEGSQDWDLILRVTELISPEQVIHVPQVLYHWRAHERSAASSISAKPYAAHAGLKAANDHVERKGLPATVSPIRLIGHNRVTWRGPDPPPLVSIVVVTTDGPFLARCVDGVLNSTSYPSHELLVLDNGSRAVSTRQFLQSREDELTVVRCEREMNISQLINQAVEQTAGSVVCLLDDRCEVRSETWLDEMIGHLMQPGVGVVGGKVLYEDGRVRHGGFTLGVAGIAHNTHQFVEGDAEGYYGQLIIAHRVSAVSQACMVVRRAVWDAVGGFDAVNLPADFNDIDFCLRVGEAGWRTIWTPHAEVVSHEPTPSGSGPDTPEPPSRIESRYMHGRWHRSLLNDPAYNPNLTLTWGDFSPAWPPRAGLS